MASYGKVERQRQAHFRAESNFITMEEARHPTDDKGLRHGHLLAQGYEEQNLCPSLRGSSGAVKFFADRQIVWWRNSRSGDVAHGTGPTRNLASSQIACVNFLMPLIKNPEALTAILQAIDKDIGEVLQISHNDRQSPVEFEWTGVGKSLEGGRGTRGANTTSTDAFMLGVTDKGVRRAYLFEWKYVEEYRIGEDKGAGKSGETRRKRYKAIYRASDSSFNGIPPMDELFFEPIYQLLRLRLLADKMIREHQFGVIEARVVVVCPRGNSAYRNRITSPPLSSRFPDARTIAELLPSLLRDPQGIVLKSQEDLIAGIRKRPVADAVKPWRKYHEERYGL